jgi:hypothetical protein
LATLRRNEQFWIKEGYPEEAASVRQVIAEEYANFHPNFAPVQLEIGYWLDRKDRQPLTLGFAQQRLEDDVLYSVTGMTRDEAV